MTRRSSPLFIARASLLALIAMASLGGCQTTRQKNLTLVKDRMDKLKPLSRFKPTWCRLEARLSQPVVARYKTLFPKEAAKLKSETLNYTWKARESACEIVPLEESPMVQNHKAILETAMCVLLQTHWVNSPFDELEAKEDDIFSADKKVQIRAAGAGEGLGLFLDRETFLVETRTKARGTFEAVYEAKGSEWLPKSIAQRSAQSQFIVDQIEYAEAPLGARRMIRSFWLSLAAGAAPDGTSSEAPIAYSQITLDDCRDY